MSRNVRMIELATRTAHLSDHPRFRLGAVIAKGSRVLSLGTNKEKKSPRSTNPHTNQHGWTIHAELAAILPLSEDNLYGSIIYIARILKSGQWGCSRPCQDCMRIIQECKIKKIVFIAKNKQIEEVKQ